MFLFTFSTCFFSGIFSGLDDTKYSLADISHKEAASLMARNILDTLAGRILPVEQGIFFVFSLGDRAPRKLNIHPRQNFGALWLVRWASGSDTALMVSVA